MAVTLLRAFDVSLSFGSRTLFSGLELVIEAGERVGLVGVNGSGKSTLMKVLAGQLAPDTGTLQLSRGARVTWLSQEPTFPEGATVASELTVAQTALREALEAHAALATRLEGGAPDERALAELSHLAERIEQLGGYDTSHQAKKLLQRLGVDAAEWDRPVAHLSGGLAKRVAIARALLSRPDLLMLDEPTNHLDADTVEWLEEELDARDSALLLVTHDRYFLDDLVDRIVEVEPYVSESQPGGLVSYPGNYEAFLEQKYVRLSEQRLAQHKRDRWIAQEVAWLRKGVEARRTKSKARIERARAALKEKGFVRPKVPELQLSHAPRLSQTVIEARGLSKAFGQTPVLADVSLIVQPGECIGVLGKNGAGKTTLLRTLLGDLAPDAGQVVLGPRTKVAYYDQLRAQLDEEQTVYEAAWHDDWVAVGQGEKARRVRLADYLEDLLFPVPMQRTKVKALSGGERNRLLLARLFLEGANVLVLDEPTNDLDLVTLNVLERLLLDFPGAVLLVTHDRYFLDKVATALWVFEGGGKVVRYEGNYSLYRRLVGSRGAPPSAPEKPEKSEPAKPPPERPPRARRSYLEQRELDGMEAAIEAAEARKTSLEQRLQEPEVYSNAAEAARLSAELEEAARQVDALYQRWQELTSPGG